MPRRPGTVPKDQLIVDGFNQKKLGPRATKADIHKAKRAANMAKARIELERKRQVVELEKMEKQLARAKKEVGIKDPKPIPDAPEPEDEVAVDDSLPPAPDEDEKSAHKMLLDLRYAYRNSRGPGGKKGKLRLVELMENDGDFKFAVKELLRIEAALLAAKIRKEGGDGEGKGPGQQNFFVVLKGLEDGPKMLEAAKGDAMVDMKQVQRAINPEQGEVYEVEEESRSAPPEQLQKAADVEGW